MVFSRAVTESFSDNEKFYYIGDAFFASLLINVVSLSRAVTESFSDNEKFYEVTQFFASYRHKLVASAKSVQQAEEHIRSF